ncbi:MAG: DUF533 domain-containing protein [Pseudomonadota bacterium]
MSLKKTAMRMAIAFAAAKGYQAFRQQGGMSGLKDKLQRSGLGGGSGSGGALGGASSGGGIGGLLGALTGGSGIGGAGAGMGGAGAGGLLGGLAAMAGGTALAGRAEPQAMDAIEDGVQDEDTAAIMVRAMGQAVRADGVIDADERAVLDEIMGQADTPEDRAVIDVALSEPIHPEALARDVPRGHEAEVYAAALTAIDPDHPAERDFLKRFATALALSPADVSHLHDMAGKPV